MYRSAQLFEACQLGAGSNTLASDTSATIHWGGDGWRDCDLWPSVGRLAQPRDRGGFYMADVGWLWLGLPEALAAAAVGMVEDATGPILWETAGKAL